MTREKVNQVLKQIELELNRTPKRYPPDDLCTSSSRALDHACYMAIEAQKPEFSDNKAMRWLGCIQGIFFAIGYKTIDELKNQNKPKGA